MSKESSNPKRDYYIVVVIMALLSGMFLLASIDNINSLNSNVGKNDLHTIKGVIMADPKISEGARGHHFIKFKLEGISDFDFMIDFPAYQATKKNELISEIQQFDNIEIDIKISEFEKKILKTKAISMFDKVNYGFINIYGLRKDKLSYLTLKDYNKEDDDNSKYTWWLYLMISIGLMARIYFERKKYKMKQL